MSRAAVRLIMFLVLLLWAAPALTAPGEIVPPPAAPVSVRQGRTEVEPPAVATAAADAEPAVAGLASSVVDAPQTGAGALQMPPLPPGFNTYDGGWVHFVYHPSSRERVQPLIAQAEAVRLELTQRLGFPVLAHVRVEVARTTGEMATFAPSGAPYPEYAAGVAYSEIGLVLLSLAPLHPGSEQDLGEVFRHELAHVALYDALNGKPVPRWFNEGFAVFASGETSFARMQTLAMSSIGGSLIPLHDIERTFPNDETKAQVAYAEAVDVLRFLVRREDAHRFRGLISELRDGKTLETGVFDAYGVELSTLEFEWREDVSRRYSIWLFLLSGSFVWVIALGVSIWAWRRRKRRDKLTLQRWARLEAAEDIQRARLSQRAEAARIHIVLTQSTDAGAQLPPPPPSAGEVEVPAIEHDGSWHTLH